MRVYISVVAKQAVGKTLDYCKKAFIRKLAYISKDHFVKKTIEKITENH